MWEELLVKPGQKMKLTTADTAMRVLEHLIRGIGPEETAQFIVPNDGIGTTDTIENYKEALIRLN